MNISVTAKITLATIFCHLSHSTMMIIASLSRHNNSMKESAKDIDVDQTICFPQCIPHFSDRYKSSKTSGSKHQMGSFSVSATPIDLKFKDSKSVATL